jgi:Putative auto-transporter adhesin, head GIN domain
MRLALLASIAAIALTSPARAETRSYEISGFTKIEADRAFEIEFSQAPSYSVVVDSKYDTLDQVIIEKHGDTLRITRPRHNNFHGKIQDTVRISAPDLKALDLSSAVRFSANGLSTDNLKIDSQAAVSIDISGLKAGSVDVHAESASKLLLAGSCAKLTLRLGAATHVDADNLKCRETDIDAGAASSVRAYASEKATAKAGVSSSVLISGHPKDFQKQTEQFASRVALAD